MNRRRIPARRGRHRGCDDVGAKARAYPRGTQRHRLVLLLWPRTFDDLVVEWLTTRGRTAAGDEA